MQKLSEFLGRRRTKIGLVMISAGALAALGFVWAQPSFQPLSTNQSRSSTTASASTATGTDATTFAEASINDVTEGSDEPVTAEASATAASNASDAVVTSTSNNSSEASVSNVSTSSGETTSLSVEASTGGGTEDVSVKVNGKEVPIAEAASGDVRVNVRNVDTLDGSRNESEVDVDREVRIERDTDDDSDDDVDQDIRTGDNDVEGNEDVGSVSNGSTSIKLYFSN